MTTEVTSEDIMKFMTSFRTSMEEKISKTNVNLESKIKSLDDKLDGKLVEINAKIDDNMVTVETEMKKLNVKLTKEADAAGRMDGRLKKLEEEMERAREIRKKTNLLKEKQRNLQDQTQVPADQPLGRNIPKKKFNRQRIVPEDLVNEEPRTYRSSWANEVKEQLGSGDRIVTENDKVEEIIVDDWENLSRGDKGDRGRNFREDRVDGDWEREEEREPRVEWQVLQSKKMTRKVRKPIGLNHWFGDEKETESDSSIDEAAWQDVDRRGKLAEKRERMSRRRKEKEVETLQKARNMLGIGPVTRYMKRRLETVKGDGELERRRIVKEILEYQLDFNHDE